MTEVTVFLDRPDGVRLTVAGRAGRSLMRAAQAAGVEGIAADCGGVLSCATCHVLVAPEWAARLPPPEPDELAMLEMTAAPHEATACRARSCSAPNCKAWWPGCPTHNTERTGPGPVPLEALS